MSVTTAYTNFIEQSRQWHQTENITMTCWADESSSSPCQLARLTPEQVQWQPVLQQPAADFSNVDMALEIVLHSDIKAFYSLYYGANLAAEHTQGKLALLMPWDQADIARLQENIIGHILMKRRLKQRETVFFAVTDDEDIMLSVLNSTGEVYLERVGQEVTQCVAANLAEFIANIKPVAYSPLFD